MILERLGKVALAGKAALLSNLGGGFLQEHHLGFLNAELCEIRGERNLEMALEQAAKMLLAIGHRLCNVLHSTFQICYDNSRI